jgi:hypothetical protein
MQGDVVESLDPIERASLGPTLLGGIVGAAVGVAAHVALETGILGTPRYEAPWFAIVIGLLTGLGVRQANRHHMNRSYARGAISGVLALAAIVLSTYLISQVMSRRDALAEGRAAKGAAPAVGDAAAAGDQGGAPAAAEAAPEQPAAVVHPNGAVGGIGRPRGDELNPWQFVFMALGALVAYEFGRGIDHSKRIDVALGEPGGAPPLVTDPSN